MGSSSTGACFDTQGDPVPLRTRTVTTHPKVLVGGMPLDYPNSLELDALLDTRK